MRAERMPFGTGTENPHDMKLALHCDSCPSRFRGTILPRRKIDSELLGEGEALGLRQVGKVGGEVILARLSKG